MKKMKKIPFFDYQRLYLDQESELLGIIKDVGSRGAFILQKDLHEFELSLAKYCGSNYAIGVGNATDGLELALLSLELKPGDEVICSTHTMIATASAIHTAGGVPVPVDIGWDNLIDPEAIRTAITSKTVGIIPTQLNGRICNMDEIMSIAESNSLFIVEDAAQALGARYKGKHAGTFGYASAISFFPAKVLGCLGDGGGVLVNNEKAYHKIFQLHDHGRDVNGEVKGWGRNSRLDNLQAAILNHKMKSYEKIISRRREVAKIYNEELKPLNEIKLPPSPENAGNNFDIYQNYEIVCNRRDNLKEFLAQNAIGTIIQWGGKGLHQWEALGLNYDLPNADLFFQKCLLLPMNIFISNEDIYFICNKIKDFYK